MEEGRGEWRRKRENRGGKGSMEEGRGKWKREEDIGGGKGRMEEGRGEWRREGENGGREGEKRRREKRREGFLLLRVEGTAGRGLSL